MQDAHVSTCHFFVIVRGTFVLACSLQCHSSTIVLTDRERPVFAAGCVANLTLPTDAGVATAVAAWANPAVTDNLGSQGTFASTCRPRPILIFDRAFVQV